MRVAVVPLVRGEDVARVLGMVGQERRAPQVEELHDRAARAPQVQEEGRKVPRVAEARERGGVHRG